MMTTSLNSPSHSITDGHNQVHQIYEQIFVEPGSKLDDEYISSGQLLDDIHSRITATNTTDETNDDSTNLTDPITTLQTYEQKLQQITNTVNCHQSQTFETMETINANHNLWHLLLPQYYINNTNAQNPKKQSPFTHKNQKNRNIEWHRLLQILNAIQFYLNSANQSPASTPTPNKNEMNGLSSSPTPTQTNTNLNISINDNQSIIRSNIAHSLTPPPATLNNLSQTRFLTQQTTFMKPFKQIQFESKQSSFNSINSNPSSPPPQQILLSAKKVMSTLRGKNLDKAILASSRKIPQNKMPQSMCKTKKCTPGIDRGKNKKYAQTAQAQPRQLQYKMSMSVTKSNSHSHSHSNSVDIGKKLHFINEEPSEIQNSNALLMDMNDESSVSSQTSHYGWKSRHAIPENGNLSGSEQNTLNISMLSHVLCDKMDTKDGKTDEKYDKLNEKIEELKCEIGVSKVVMEEFEKNISEKTMQCRNWQSQCDSLQSQLNEYKKNCEELKEKCLTFEEMKEKNSEMELKITNIMSENVSLKQSLDTNKSAYESKCSTFVTELNKTTNESKEKQAHNIRLENELKIVKTKLQWFKNRVSKMSNIDLCKSKLMGLTTDYKSLKNTIKHELQRQEQEFRLMISVIKSTLETQTIVQHTFMDHSNDSIMCDSNNNECEFEIVTQERNELKSNLIQLNNQYQNEKKLRKKLLEQLIDLKGNIRVFCRVRPKIKREITANKNENKNNNSEPELMATTCLDDELIVINDENKKEFKFDQIYKPNTSQSRIFGDVKPLIHSCVDGYNVCIFAYGQTGSGKTYTMEGTQSNPGVIYRTFDELFALKANENSKLNRKDMKIWLSCLEIYNEKIRDLLASKMGNTLKAKLSKCGKKVLVPGLTKKEIFSTENVRQYLLNTVYKNRSTGITNMNEHSSRSHALLFIDIETKAHVSRLVLIDLAGSERVKKTGVSGTAFDEARSINKSLSALGNVINSLQTKQKHIPFRDSQLTYLLYDCLGGNSRALMFCNVSCELFDVKESVNTLQFANRVRRVQLGEAQKNENNTDNGNGQSSASASANNGGKQNDLKYKLKKLKRDLEEREKEMNHLKMNNRNYKKEITKLNQSLGAQSNKNANIHQTRIEFNNLQKEHSRLSQDLDKKDKLIKKLSNDVSDYKHKIVQLKHNSNLQSHNSNNSKSGIRQRSATFATMHTRNKNINKINPRKRKLPSDTTKSQSIQNNSIDGPSKKRRKVTKNNNLKNKRKSSNNNNNRKNMPSYLMPTRNSRSKIRHMRGVKNPNKTRSISLDSTDNTNEHRNNGSNNLNLSSISIDSAVSSLNKRIHKPKPRPRPKPKPKPKAKQQKSVPKTKKISMEVFTPATAMEALKNGTIMDSNVIRNNNAKNTNKNGNAMSQNKGMDSQSKDRMKRKSNTQPITLSSLMAHNKSLI